MTRTVTTRLELLRRNAKVCNLEMISAPKIVMRASSAIKTSLSATVLSDSRANWLTDEVRAVLTIDGVDYHCGVFIPATVTETTEGAEMTVSFEAYDRCWYCKSSLWVSPRRLREGTNYIAAVERLLQECGLNLLLKTPTAARLVTDRVWDSGTPILSIINELLSEINYKPLWFNADGYAVLQPLVTPSAERIEHRLDGNDIRSLLLPQATRETDIYSAANVFVVTCSNPEYEEPLVATAVNNNPSSPLSTIKRGRRIYHFERVNNIANQEELNKYADNLRWQSMAIGETVSVSTALLPGFGVNDVVALNIKNASGLYLSTGWTMDFVSGGDMSHTLERVVFTY